MTWSQSFSQEFVFLSIFFFTQFFCVRHGGMMQCAAPQCGMCGGWGRDFPSTGGGLGVLPQEFFYKYKLWKGHFGAILKTPEKKRLFTEAGKKKGLKGFPRRPVTCTTSVSRNNRKWKYIFVSWNKFITERDDINDEEKWEFSVQAITGLILGLHPANESRRYKVTASLIGWVQT